MRPIVNERPLIRRLDPHRQLTEIQLIAVAHAGGGEIERAGTEAAGTDRVRRKVLETNVVEHAGQIEPLAVDTHPELGAIADEGVIRLADWSWVGARMSMRGSKYDHDSTRVMLETVPVTFGSADCAAAVAERTSTKASVSPSTSD